MLDEFREQAETASSFKDDESTSYDEYSYSQGRPFLGMTPFQRFVVALLILIITVILSTFCLLVTGKIVPPFL